MTLPLLLASTVNAQYTEAQPDYSQSAFKRTKFVNFGYVSSTIKPENSPKWGSNYGFSFSNGNRYWLHKTPIAGMIKFALDATWIDITYTNLKVMTWEEEYGGSTRYGYDDYYDDDDEFSEINIGSHQLEIGLGIGPSVTIAPFTAAQNQLKDLRGTLYFHCIPSFSGIFMDQGDGMKLNYGIVPFLKFGGCINWKALSFWVEGRWGSANYNLASAGDEDEDYDDEDYEPGIRTDKWSIKTSSVRFGIGISF